MEDKRLKASPTPHPIPSPLKATKVWLNVVGLFCSSCLSRAFCFFIMSGYIALTLMLSVSPYSQRHHFVSVEVKVQ